MTTAELCTNNNNMAAAKKKLVALHTGFAIDAKALEQGDVKEALGKYLGDNYVTKFRKDIYTAVKFKESHSEMMDWYGKRHKKGIMKGYIKALYKDVMKRVIVAEITVDSLLIYITLMNEKNINLLNVKMMANRGDFGAKIVVDPKIAVDCTAYMKYYD